MTDNTLTPLEEERVVPGVAPSRVESNGAKRFAVVGMCAVTFVAAIGFAATKYFGGRSDAPDKPVASPDVASAQAPRLEMPTLAAASSPASMATPGSAVPGTESAQTVPSIAPLPGEVIGVRGNGGQQMTGSVVAASSGSPPVKVLNPDDAPIFSAGAVPDMHAPATVAMRSSGSRVADANASLDAYQRQLAGMLENLQTLTSSKPGNPGPAFGTGAAAPSQLPAMGLSNNSQAATPPLFGSLDRSATPSVQARLLGDRNMIVPKGTLFLCNLKTRVVSATSGFIGCQVTRNILSDSGRVLLIERGSHLDGEYRIVSVKPGVTRIPVLWTRVRTPQGVTIDLESPATGALGESGLGGFVDNRWAERLGAAVMLSFVNDALKYAIASQSSNDSTTVLLPNTTDQGSKLAEKVLETTINIPPLLYQNQGGVVGVYVSRDLDFSSVYELRPQ